MDPLDTKKRIFAVHKLLVEKTTTKQKFESVRTLIKGLNPRIDAILIDASKALSELEKIQKGEFIELSAEHLPENTEEEKKRKKAFLWFVGSWKDLKGEVERVKKEFEQGKQGQNQQISSAGKIIAFAKGPFGMMTALAVIAVIVLSVFGVKKETLNKTVPQKQTAVGAKIKVIIVDGKQIPLTELTTSQGPECLTGSEETSHYHVKDHTTAKALDGSIVSDPGGCGFGKVSEVRIIEVE